MQNQETENKNQEIAEQINDIKVKVHFTYIEAIKQADSKFSNLEYPVDMNLGEATHKLDGTAVMRFSLRVATNPQVAVFAVKGEAILKGSTEKMQKALIPEKNSPPPIWMEIYKEAISTISFISRFLDIPPPPITANIKTED